MHIPIIAHQKIDTLTASFFLSIIETQKQPPTIGEKNYETILLHCQPKLFTFLQTSSKQSSRCKDTDYF